MPLHRFSWFRDGDIPQPAAQPAPALAFTACPAAVMQGMSAGHVEAVQQVYAAAYERVQQQQRRERRLARLYAVSAN